MLKVKQFRYHSDNLGYLVYGLVEAIAIDPGAPEIIFEFIKDENLFLKKIYNTHNHFDHLMGNEKLEELSGMTSVKNNELPTNDRIEIGDDFLSIIHTPGHTKDSICFYYKDKFIITGDTLFIANVGNCPDKDAEIFLDGLNKIQSLPDNVEIYPGHDYTERSLKRAMVIEPSNMDILEFQKSYSRSKIVSSIGTEKKINTYLRTDKDEVVKHLLAKGMDISSPLARFKSFLKLY